MLRKVTSREQLIIPRVKFKWWISDHRQGRRIPSLGPNLILKTDIRRRASWFSTKVSQCPVHKVNRLWFSNRVNISKTSIFWIHRISIWNLRVIMHPIKPLQKRIISTCHCRGRAKESVIVRSQVWWLIQLSKMPRMTMMPVNYKI